MLKKFAVILAAVLLAAGGFFSCGSDAGKTVLRVVHFGGSDFPDTFNRATAKWRAQNPNVKIMLEYVPWGNYTDKILTEVAGGSSPDAGWIENSQAASLVPRGALLPLNDFLEKDKSVSLRDYWPAIVDRYTYDGKTYCLPSDVAPIACVYYNKNLFQTADLPYPKDDWDWNDLVSIAKKLTIKNPDGTVKQYGFFTTDWGNFVYSAGGRMVDNVKKPAHCVLNSPEAVAGLEFFFDLVFKHGVMPALQGQGALQDMSQEQMFIFKKAAMVLSGIWLSGQFRKSVTDFEWDIALAPRAPGKPYPVLSTGGSGWGVLKYSKHPEIAWELVKIMTGKEVLTRMAKENFQPAMIELSKSTNVWCKYPPDPRNKRILNMAMEHVVFTPFTSKWWEIDSKVFQPEFQKIWERTRTVRETMNTVVREADKILQSKN